MKPIGFRIEEGLLRVMIELLNTSACSAGTSDCGVQLQHSTMEAPIVWTGKSVSKDAIYLSIISRRKYRPRSASDEVKMEAYLHGRPGKWEVEMEPSLYSRSVSKAETYATIIWVLQQVGYLGCTPRHARPFAAEDRPCNVLVPTGIEPFPKPSSFALLGVSFSVGSDNLEKMLKSTIILFNRAHTYRGIIGKRSSIWFSNPVHCARRSYVLGLALLQHLLCAGTWVFLTVAALKWKRKVPKKFIETLPEIPFTPPCLEFLSLEATSGCGS